MFRKVVSTLCRLFIIIGLSFFILGIIGYFGMPPLIQTLVESQIKLNYKDKQSYEGWQHPKIPIYMKVYLFNITNPEDVILGKPFKLEEIGPYIFTESRWKMNVTINNTNGTISYIDRKQWVFEPHLSKGSLDDNLTHINIPLLSMGDKVQKLGSEEFMYTYIEEIIQAENVKFFETHTVDQMLFTGYEDPILNGALAMNLKVPEKFGLFFGRNSSDSLPFEINNGHLDMNTFGRLKGFNNNNQMNFWKGDPCNQFIESTTGELNPPFKSQKQMQLFVADLCRSLPLKFAGEEKHFDILTNRYILDPSAFDYSLEQNQCFCIENDKCPLNGVFLNAPCAEGAPSAVSFPHFLHGDKFYQRGFHGLRPNFDEHTFFLDVEPTLGVVVKVSAKLQINFRIRKDIKLEYTKFMTQDELFIPVFWVNTEAELNDDLITKVSGAQMVIPFMMSVIPILAIGFGLITLIFGFVLNCFTDKPKKSDKIIDRNNYAKVATTSFNY